jgi:hypothetical protein
MIGPFADDIFQQAAQPGQKLFRSAMLSNQ